MKKEDIHIDVDGDRLSISAERSAVREEKDDGHGLGLLGQGERQYAVSVGGGDILPPDAGDVEAPGEGAVGAITA